MINQDAIDLYNHTPVGTKVVVLSFGRTKGEPDRIAGLKRLRGISVVKRVRRWRCRRLPDFVANARLKAPQHTGSHARCDCAILPPLAAAKAVLPQFAHSFPQKSARHAGRTQDIKGILDSVRAGRTRRELCVIRLRCFEAFFPRLALVRLS